VDELRDAEAVRAHYGEPSHMSKAKQLDHLDAHCKAFIKLSPFVVMATTDAAGRADASPRGDKPGLVATVIDDKTLIIPDRVGNRRTDTINNITENPHVGLLFMVPGINETLRVNGTVRVVIHPSSLEPLAFEGKMPMSGFVVTAEEVFFHCGKPLIRSELWNPERRLSRERFPSLGKILADQIAGDKTAEEFDQGIDEQYRTRLY
jgi:PPOX class probable FMN-dependent enzyme